MDNIKIVKNIPILLYGYKLPIGTAYGKKPITVSVPYVDDDGINRTSTKTYNFIYHVSEYVAVGDEKRVGGIRLYHHDKWYNADLTNDVGIPRIDMKYRMAVQMLVKWVNENLPNDVEIINVKSNRQKKREALTLRHKAENEARQFTYDCGAPRMKKTQIATKSMVYRGIPGYATNPNVISDGGFVGVAPSKSKPKLVEIHKDKPKREDVTFKTKNYKHEYRHDGNSIARVIDKSGHVVMVTNYSKAVAMCNDKNGYKTVEY